MMMFAERIGGRVGVGTRVVRKWVGTLVGVLVPCPNAPAWEYGERDDQVTRRTPTRVHPSTLHHPCPYTLARSAPGPTSFSLLFPSSVGKHHQDARPLIASLQIRYLGLGGWRRVLFG